MERPRIIQGAPKDHPTPRKEQPLGTAQVAPKTTQDAPKTHPRRTWSTQESSKEHPRITRAHAWSSQGSLRPTQGRGAPPWTHGHFGPWTLRVQAAPLWGRGKARHRGRCRADRIVSEDLWAPPPRPFAAGGRNLVWSWDWLPASRKAPTPWGREPRLERWSWSWASRGGDAENCGAPKKKAMGVWGGKQTQKLSKLFKPFRNATTLLKHFQTSSNLFETLQNFSNLLKPFQTFSNLFKPLLAL